MVMVREVVLFCHEKTNHPPSPMTASHDTSSKPSILLVLVCLAVVHRLRPRWISITLDEAARAENVNPQRLSRLCSKAIDLFHKALDTLTRIGRPSRKGAEDVSAEKDAIVRAMLEVATSILKHVSFRKPAIHALIVGAYLRLKEAYPTLTKKLFCDSIALSERTFRHWMKHAGTNAGGTPIAAAKQNPTTRNRPSRRPRFSFQVTLPDTQIAADTTDLKAFDIPLKLVAAQDVGGRDQDLLDSIIIDDKESADHVIQAITQALDTKPGQQVLTDQGTPYMAEATRAALEELEAQHAPQKEGHPQGKATVERAFGTVKTIAGPLLHLTSQIAKLLPILRDVNLAKAATTLLLTALLKAYQAGARATQKSNTERAGVSKEEIAELAEQSRQNAIAEDRSIRLLLANIHRDYDIKKPLADFIRKMRRFGLPVLRDAEKRFATQVHRDDIRDRASYFAAIARRVSEEHRIRHKAQQRQKEEDQKREQNSQNVDARNAHWHANPTAWLQDAFKAIAKQWIPERRELFLGGAGIGRGWLTCAIKRLIELHGHSDAIDIASGAFTNFEITDPEHIGPDGLIAIQRILETALGKKQTSKTLCTSTFTSTILRNTGPPLRPTP